jgi:hypothetical protein
MLKQLRVKYASDNLPIVLLVLMMGGLLFSRALLSLSQLGWVAWIIMNWRRREHNADAMRSWSLLVIPLALLGCWQSPFTGRHFDYLLTLIMYPIAFFSLANLSVKLLRYFSRICQLAALTGIVYALAAYSLEQTVWFEAYGAGKSLPTFMDTDHVRFGIFLCGTGLLTWQEQQLSKKIKYSLLFILLSAIVFMSVRTAWMGAAISVLTCSFFAPAKNNWLRIRRLLVSIAVIVSLALISYLLFPTVQQKWAYMVYDWQHYSPQTDRLNYSDGARRLLNAVAWNAITEKGTSNQGWAGIATALQTAFSQQYPGKTLPFTWPFNQWLFWWMGAGLLGMIFFTTWLFFPALQGYRKNNSGTLAWTLVIIASCWVECTLSFQYGVWLHAWIGAAAWYIQERESKPENISE